MSGKGVRRSTHVPGFFTEKGFFSPFGLGLCTHHFIAPKGRDWKEGYRVFTGTVTESAGEGGAHGPVTGVKSRLTYTPPLRGKVSRPPRGVSMKGRHLGFCLSIL